MDNMKICQSCGMPLESEEHFGTNKDGSKNEDYCVYCFKEGSFMDNMSMDEMISHCAEHAEEWAVPMSKDEYVKQMRRDFPKLKRWRTA